MSVKKRIPLKAGKRLGLTHAVRFILSSGHDFLSELDHLTPIPKDKWGKIEGNLWSYIPGYYKPTPYDAPTDQPDARVDFLRDEWARHKDEVLQWHLDKHRDGSRPWAWWMWSSPEPYPPFVLIGHDDWAGAKKRQELQASAILIRHNLLTPTEEAAIREQDTTEAALRASGPDDDLLEAGKK